MILGSEEIVSRLEHPEPSRRLYLVPRTSDPAKCAPAGGASLELRLGAWFLSLKQTNQRALELFRDASVEAGVTRTHYVRFGREFILHPRSFVLAATLEWIKLPLDLAGYVIGKSSVGRHGLVIATATGVHPGFTGCLTLEIGNLGELPIPLRPGMKIGQLFLHVVENPAKNADESGFACTRRPVLLPLKNDPIADALKSGPLGGEPSNP